MKKTIMLKILAIWTIAICAYSSKAQVYLRPNNSYGYIYNRVKIDSVLHIPTSSDTSYRTNDNSPQIRLINGQLKYRYGKWYTLADSATLGGNIGGKLNITDTQAMLAPYTRLQVLNDSVGNKVKYTDTAAMLQPYAKNANTYKYSDTANSFARFLKYTDSSSFLSPYLRRSDTSTLSNRISILASVLPNKVDSVYLNNSRDTLVVTDNGNVTKTALGISSAALPSINTKEIHVDGATGNDGYNGTLLKPFATIGKAASVANGSGYQIVIHPSTYTENVTFNQANLSVTGSNNEQRGVVYIQGTITMSGTSSSQSLSNIMCTNVTHSGAASLYASNCTINGTYTKTSNAYSENKMLDVAATNITGSNYAIFISSKITAISINNASASVYCNLCYQLVAPTVSNGIFSAENSVIYATTNTGNAITGSGTISLANCRLITPSGTDARVNITGLYSFRDVAFDKTNSTLGTNIGSVSYTDNISIINPTTITTATKYLVRDAGGIVREQSIIDTSTLSTRIDARVKYTDTSAMLSTYSRNISVVKYTDTSSMLSSRVKYGDTSLMLSKYLRKLDTATLSARIDTRVKYSDTLTRIAAKPYASGTITTDSVVVYNTSTGTLRTVSPSLLGGSSSSNLAGFRNRIINGNFRFTQKYGLNADVMDATKQFYGIDRWCSNSNTANDTRAKYLVSSSIDNDGSYYARLTTTALGGLDLSDYYTFGQKIEGCNVADLFFGFPSAKTITLSFLAKSNIASTFSGSLHNSALNRSYVFTYTITSANTWTPITITIPGDITGTWLRGIGETGLFLNFCMGAGDNYLTSNTNTWMSGTYYQSTNSTNLVNLSFSVSLNLKNVQLEVGSRATDFEYRPFQLEMELCQRYFAKSYDIDVVPGTNTFYGRFLSQTTTNASGSSAHISGTINFPIIMNRNPDVVIYTQSGAINYVGVECGYTGNSKNASVTMSTNATANGTADARGFTLYPSLSGLGFSGGQYLNIYGHYTADAELQ